MRPDVGFRRFRVKSTQGSVVADREEKKLAREVKISGRMGLHGRPAAELVKLASQFKSQITLCRPSDPENVADCRSVLSLLILAATDGTSLVLSASGPDCEAAIEAVGDFFAAGFVEEPAECRS